MLGTMEQISASAPALSQCAETPVWPVIPVLHKASLLSTNWVAKNYWGLGTTFRSDVGNDWMEICIYSKQNIILAWNQDVNLHFLCRHLEWLWCFCRSLPGPSVAEQHCVIPSYLCNVSEHLWLEFMSNFVVEWIGTEVFTWSPPSEADAEGDVQLVDDCEYIVLVPFSTTSARPIRRCPA